MAIDMAHNPSTTSTSAGASIEVQPAALLVQTSASTTIEALNTALQSYRLCLPIVPLQQGQTLAELVRRNAGGRRHLAYGTIARYIRAASLQPADGTGPPLRVGGPTLKRATGYNLQRVVVGDRHHYLPGSGRLLDLTLNVQPLPAARCELLIVCAGLAAACRLAAQMIQTGAALSALAVMDETCVATVRHSPVPSPLPAGVALLLAELEGIPSVLERQAQQLATLCQEAHTPILHSNQYDPAHPHQSHWAAWELLAAQPADDPAATLAVNLPRLALPSFIEQTYALARRYGRGIAIQGDAGVGRLHLHIESMPSSTMPNGEAAQARAVLTHIARQMGGVLSTDSAATTSHRPPIISRHQPPLATTRHQRSSFVAHLQQHIGAQYVLTRPGDLVCYSADASIARAEGLPLAVALPSSTAEVSTIVQMAAAAGVPVITRGAGSGLAGGATPVPGALLLALTRMQRCSINTAQQVAHVEAGVVTAEIQQAAEMHGLLYAPDPSSQGVSTIGGNIACNAGGPRCLKYGVTANYVLGLTAVLADGQVVRVGDDLAAQTADAGLLHLLVGSEGTLAIITEARLRLIAQPATRRTVLAFFDRLDDACATVESIMAAGVLPAGLELMDDTCIRVVEDAMALGLPRDAGALLLLLVDGEPEAVEWEAQHLAELARRGRARSVQLARSASDEAAFWKARRSVSPAFARVRPNKLGEDICVPLPQIANTVRRIKAIAERYSMPIPVFGHAGDGNLHPNILFDARSPAEVERVWQAAEEIFQLALELGGTLSGEHGIGTLKRPFLGAALGDDVLTLHRAIKTAFDPQGILNPGRVV